MMKVDVYTVGLNLKESVIFPPGCPRYTQQRDEPFIQLIGITVPFHMINILYGSSDFSYK